MKMLLMALVVALVAALVLGIWALVLKPSITSAHDYNKHNCDISGDITVQGRREDRSVTMLTDRPRPKMS